MANRRASSRLSDAASAIWWSLKNVCRVVDAILWRAIRLLRAIFVTIFAFALALITVICVAAWEVSHMLPDNSTTLMDGRDRGSIAVLNAEGTVLGIRGHRFSALTIAEAGPILVDAILSIEDRRFYWHVGVDPIGLSRAIIRNYQRGHTTQGGSSITQQVVKLAFLSNERTLSRKMRELPLAVAMEWKYAKDEILALYLNRAYLGAGAFGFRTASRFYFGKEPKNLTHAEAALLAGLLRAPSKWSPLNNFEAAQARAKDILNAMLDSERLTKLEHRAAVAQIAYLRPPVVTEFSPYFVDWVADQIPEAMQRHSADLIVKTTLDPKAQRAAEDAVARVFKHRVSGYDENAQAAVVVVSPDGAVKAMVGGRDYAQSQFNRATLARRQLGSAFKPIVYAAALQTGLTASSKIEDSPIKIDTWSPENYTHIYRGPIPLSTALAKSSNVAAVRLQQHVGTEGVVDMARRFGFSGDIPAVPSLSLGTLETNAMEVATAYSVFANGGAVTPSYGVTEIRDKGGRLIWKRRKPRRRQAITIDEASEMREMMVAVVERGTAHRVRIAKLHIAGKTGTTQNYRDAWFAGYTDKYTAAVWVGHDDFRSMHRVTGSGFPAEIWREALAPLYDEAAIWGIEGEPHAHVSAVVPDHVGERVVGRQQAKSVRPRAQQSTEAADNGNALRRRVAERVEQRRQAKKRGVSTRGDSDQATIVTRRRTQQSTEAADNGNALKRRVAKRVKQRRQAKKRRVTTRGNSDQPTIVIRRRTTAPQIRRNIARRTLTQP
jgi:1A family penicillin-binding protein